MPHMVLQTRSPKAFTCNWARVAPKSGATAYTFCAPFLPVSFITFFKVCLFFREWINMLTSQKSKHFNVHYFQSWWKSWLFWFRWRRQSNQRSLSNFMSRSLTQTTPTKVRNPLNAIWSKITMILYLQTFRIPIGTHLGSYLRGVYAEHHARRMGRVLNYLVMWSIRTPITNKWLNLHVFYSTLYFR